MPIAALRIEDRLSRNLDDRDFTDEINNQICRLANRKVLEDMVIAIDPGNAGIAILAAQQADPTYLP